VFSTYGVEAARTNEPLADWALYQNPHNKRRALELLEDLNRDRVFLGRGETVLSFFRTFKCGAGMTLRGLANRSGFWVDDQQFASSNVVGGGRPL
jgi:hypothetical protein